MNYNNIFNSDYFTINMIIAMSARELYFYRQTNQYTYKNITEKTIQNKIIEDTIKRLKLRLGDQYNEFIDIIQKRKMILHGPFITENIWGEWHDTSINLNMSVDDMGTIKDNMFIDFKNFDIMDCDLFKKANRYLTFECCFTTTLKKYNIEIDIFSDGIYECFPKIFQNYIRVHEGQFIINIKSYKSMMHKIQSISFSNSENYIDDSWYLKETKKLCEHYNIKYNFLPYDNIISIEDVIPIIVINNEYISMLNQCFISNKYNRISCDEIKVINNSKINKLYVDVEIQPFVIDCQLDDCPFKILSNTNPIEHFHSCIFCKQNDNKFICKSIVLKYQNNELFVNHKLILSQNINHINEIDGKHIENVNYWEFPDKLKHNVIHYKKMFNNDFLEGEYILP